MGHNYYRPSTGSTTTTDKHPDQLPENNQRCCTSWHAGARGFNSASALWLNVKTGEVRMGQWENAVETEAAVPLSPVSGGFAAGYHQPPTGDITQGDMIWRPPMDQTCYSEAEKNAQDYSLTIQDPGVGGSEAQGGTSSDEVKKPSFDEILKKAMNNVSDQLMALLEAELDRMENEGEEVEQESTSKL